MASPASSNNPTLDAATKNQRLRALPAVDALVDAVVDKLETKTPSRVMLTRICRDTIEHQRQQILQGDDAATEMQTLAQLATEAWHRSNEPVLSSVINATGILLHTGLGRSPLSDQAVAALTDVAKHYAPVELDMASGKRNRRADVVRSLLCELTGSESATVVNNNAAATLLTLAAVAENKEVIVSRGELIEIGGSFRLPDVMEISRATLKEVGTTNRTRISDYAKAITPQTGAILKAHSSNYRIVGFTEDTGIKALVKLGNEHGIPVIDDIGSGALHDMHPYGLGDEPVAKDSIDAGADLVLFSGDKLLGGPQAGIIVGKREWIERIETHPLYRAFRVDKLTFAALASTLQIHRDPQAVQQHIPLYIMLSLTMEQLHERAKQLTTQLENKLASADVQVIESEAFVGGGTTPAQAVPSVAVRITPKSGREQQWADQLRQTKPPVLVRIAEGGLWFDMRSIMPDQFDALAKCIMDIAEAEV